MTSVLVWLYWRIKAWAVYAYAQLPFSVGLKWFDLHSLGLFPDPDLICTRVGEESRRAIFAPAWSPDEARAQLEKLFFAAAKWQDERTWEAEVAFWDVMYVVSEAIGQDEWMDSKPLLDREAFFQQERAESDGWYLPKADKAA